MSKKRRERVIIRLLEILPGFVSWNLILFPYWGVFVMPNIVAYFVLLFNIYWFYNSFQIAITSTISHIRMQASMKNDWVADLKKDFEKEWYKVKNFIIIPTYKEPLYILERTLRSIEVQTLPQENIIIVIAQEFRAPEEHRMEIEAGLKKVFGKKMNLIFTVHKLSEGEII
jgi:cellulose synthase/poly-beta-1,6-N-acetylglucosamine synthase-like glycosyltransferase